MISLLYVSRASLQQGQEESEISDIVAISLARNSDLNVTGSLIYTGAHFAQILEGSQRAIDQLMASIEKDDRHRDVTIVDVQRLPKRTFSNWAMAYSGPSPYIDRHIKPLLSPRTPDVAKEALVASLLTTISAVGSTTGNQNLAV